MSRKNLQNKSSIQADEVKVATPAATEESETTTLLIPTARTPAQYQPNPVISAVILSVLPLSACYFVAGTWEASAPEDYALKAGMLIGTTLLFTPPLLAATASRQRFERLKPSEKINAVILAAANVLGMIPAVCIMLQESARAVEKGDHSGLAIEKITSISLFALGTLMNTVSALGMLCGLIKKNPTLDLFNSLPGFLGSFGFLANNAATLHEANNAKTRTTPIDMVEVSVAFIAAFARLLQVAIREMMQVRANAQQLAVEANSTPAPENIQTPAAPTSPLTSQGTFTTPPPRSLSRPASEGNLTAAETRSVTP